MSKVLVLGGGISGLTAAWKLKDDYDVTLLEGSSSPGGVMQSITEPHFFELGPRTFKGALSLKELIEDVGCKIISADPAAKRRYIYWKQKLHAVPPKKTQLFSELGRLVLGAIWRDLRAPKAVNAETIGAFARHRFGNKATEVLFDPVVKGIFAGDLDKLSLSECFPKLQQWEDEFGSVVKGFMQMKKSPLFTIDGGTGYLTAKMANSLDVRYNTRVEKITKNSVHTDQGLFEADIVISALPVHALCHIDNPHQEIFHQIETVSLTIVNMAFAPHVQLPPGFGYLIPRIEKEKILGVVFDSAVFPHQSLEGQTRLTVMLSSHENAEGIARKALVKHLHIKEEPSFCQMTHYPSVLPQYTVGHRDLVAPLKEDKDILWVGNYLEGASVNACINYATRALKNHPVFQQGLRCRGGCGSR